MSADLSTRLEYLALTQDDLDELAKLRPLLESRADEFVAAFYRHLLVFESTRSLLSDPGVKDRLLKKQREYLLQLASGRIDERYVGERLRIGDTHERVGLEPRWYLGAYALYTSLLIPMIGEHFKGGPEAERAVSALVKLLMLDAQLAMEAYIQKRESQLEYLARELASASRELERSYGEQTAELRETTERARSAEQLAQIGTLVAGLAHEIGTPMGVIQGHADMLESSVEDERGRWRLQTIREQIDRISGIIQTLLNLARPRELERAPVALGALVERSLDFLGEKLERRRIAVTRELADDAMLLGDAQKLQQLFLNLFLNAADAMPQGGSLRVALQRNGSELRVTVADTGEGIPESQLARVFEPFFTTKPAGRGSGLGLMMVQSIAEEHGGSVRFESREGEGTTVELQLPAL